MYNKDINSDFIFSCESLYILVEEWNKICCPLFVYRSPTENTCELRHWDPCPFQAAETKAPGPSNIYNIYGKDQNTILWSSVGCGGRQLGALSLPLRGNRLSHLHTYNLHQTCILHPASCTTLCRSKFYTFSPS